MKLRTMAALAVAAVMAPAPASAFCGFYVAAGNDPLFDDATQVVLMRRGTRTVLSMQNNYKGPPEAFAMVIPVPVVLHDGDVKTLARDVFRHVEQMGAPRLVEYWEQDPCARDARDPTQLVPAPPPTVSRGRLGINTEMPDPNVVVEAQFVVGEYQIVILSAKDSTALDAWLRHEHYRIPDGAEPLLRPYVENGMKFFVAKVDPTKVTFDADHRAALSPLRFHYDSDELSLPIRLGLANSSGTQDLIVNILSPRQRYDVANYGNVTIPTNIDVDDSVRDKFGAFYAALFDRTLEKNRGAVVTEYAWQATTCDPCPGPTLQANELASLGADVLGGTLDKPEPVNVDDLVLTRLHARYGKDVKDDLVFEKVAPIVGGREFVVDRGRLEEGARPDPENNFQGRYAIRHAWTGPMACEHPFRYRWGGPPPGTAAGPGFESGTMPATNLAFAPRDQVVLSQVVERDVPEIDVHPSLPGAYENGPMGPQPREPAMKRTGCGCEAGSDDVLGGGTILAPIVVLRRRRRVAYARSLAAIART